MPVVCPLASVGQAIDVATGDREIRQCRWIGGGADDVFAIGGGGHVVGGHRDRGGFGIIHHRLDRGFRALPIGRGS